MTKADNEGDISLSPFVPTTDKKSMTNIASKCWSANIVRDHATILPNDATSKPDGIFGKDTKGMIPFRRLRWCSTCVIVGSTPAVDV